LSSAIFKAGISVNLQDILVTVVKQARERWGVDVQYIEPFNEPTPGVWTFGSPANGMQEGCNFPYPDQVIMINDLHNELSKQGLQQTVGIVASDETSMDWGLRTWGFLTASPGQPIAKISKVNVHGYAGTLGHGTDPYRGSNRSNLRNAVRSAAPGTKIWMSEFGDGDISGMTMATSIMLDMTELQPSAWVQWQVIDPSWGFFANPQEGGVIGRYMPNIMSSPNSAGISLKVAGSSAIVIRTALLLTTQAPQSW
jgi:galactan endo-1,6-beta-galactosidase